MAAVVLGVSLGGCGVVERVMATPTITALPPPDDIIASAPPASATTSPEAPGPPPGPLQAIERLVVVDSLGIGLAAPTLFSDIDPEKYLAGSAALDELSRGMGLRPDQVRQGLLDQIDRMVVGKGDDGRPASIVVARTPMAALPSEAQLRTEIGGRFRGTVKSITRPATPAGNAVLARYVLGGPGDRHYGEELLVKTADDVVSVTVTAGSAAEAARLVGRVVRTIRVIE